MRNQYINARNTFDELLKFGVVPIVNENDTVAVEQLRFGDNDTLSAHVAILVQAHWLFLMTDVNALYTANPRTDPDATPIHSISYPELGRLMVDTSGGTQWGTGGMATKLTAARMATAAGCKMVICHFEEPRNVIRVLQGEEVGTIFGAQNTPLRWVAIWALGGAVQLVVGGVGCECTPALPHYHHRLCKWTWEQSTPLQFSLAHSKSIHIEIPHRPLPDSCCMLLWSAGGASAGY